MVTDSPSEDWPGRQEPLTRLANCSWAYEAIFSALWVPSSANSAGSSKRRVQQVYTPSTEGFLLLRKQDAEIFGWEKQQQFCLVEVGLILAAIRCSYTSKIVFILVLVGTSKGLKPGSKWNWSGPHSCKLTLEAARNEKKLRTQRPPTIVDRSVNIYSMTSKNTSRSRHRSRSRSSSSSSSGGRGLHCRSQKPPGIDSEVVAMCQTLSSTPCLLDKYKCWHCLQLATSNIFWWTRTDSKQIDPWKLMVSFDYDTSSRISSTLAIFSASGGRRKTFPSSFLRLPTKTMKKRGSVLSPKLWYEKEGFWWWTGGPRYPPKKFGAHQKDRHPALQKPHCGSSLFHASINKERVGAFLGENSLKRQVDCFFFFF